SRHWPSLKLGFSPSVWAASTGLAEKRARGWSKMLKPCSATSARKRCSSSEIPTWPRTTSIPMPPSSCLTSSTKPTTNTNQKSKNKKYMKLKLVLIPVNSPEKGADDVKAKLNEKFLDFYDGLTRSAYSMTGTELNSTLPVELARRQMEAMKTLTGDNRAKAEKNLLNSAAMLKRHPLRQAEIMDLIHECFGHKASVIKQAVEQARVDLFNGSNGHEWKKPAPRAA